MPNQTEQSLEETNKLAKMNRAANYRETSDPIFFKWQRGEATEQEWLDSIQAIKEAFPDSQ